jgi:hypothetical protein
VKNSPPVSPPLRCALGEATRKRSIPASAAAMVPAIRKIVTVAPDLPTVRNAIAAASKVIA